MKHLLIIIFALFSPFYALAQEMDAQDTHFDPTTEKPAVTTKNPNAKEGASPRNKIDEELLYKVRFGQLEDVHILLKSGANPAQVNEIGWPLVSIAASRDDGSAVPILRELVKADADINRGGPSRMFPVIVAARRGDKELMDFLLFEALANFNVKDANGVSVRDIAAKGGYPEIAAQIDKLQTEREKAMQEMYSPERRAQLIHDLLFYSCANEYMGYYFKSKQDPHTKDQIDDVMGTLKGRLSIINNDLVQIFKYDYRELYSMMEQPARSIYNDLETLISNRNRRAHGVGSEGDLDRRCNAIAAGIIKKSAEKAAKRNRK